MNETELLKLKEALETAKAEADAANAYFDAHALDEVGVYTATKAKVKAAKAKLKAAEAALHAAEATYKDEQKKAT